MPARAKWVLVSAALGAGAASAVWAWRAGTPGPVAAAAPADELRWVPVENADIFYTMGARVWRLHVPADRLRGRSGFVLTTTRDGEKPRDVLRAPLRESRKETDPVDLTFVMYWDTPTHSEVKRIHLSLTSAEFGAAGSVGNPLPGFNGYAQLSDLADLAEKGIEVGRVVKTDNDAPPGKGEKVLFNLRLE